MCPTASGSVTDEQRAQDTTWLISNPEESLGPHPETHINPEGRTSSPFFSRHPRLTDSTPTSTRHSSAAGFSKRRSSYDATISPQFKYSPIPARAVLHIGGYLDMSIPTIVHNHQSNYERISKCKSCKSEKYVPSPIKYLYAQRSMKRRDGRNCI